MIGHSALGEEDDFLSSKAETLRNAFYVAAIKEVQRIDINKDPEYFQAREDIVDFTSQTIQRYEKSKADATSGKCPFKNDGALISLIMKNDEKGAPLFNKKQQADELSTFMFAG